MCMIDEDGIDGRSVYRESLVRARKSHRCDECYRTIAEGETYQYVFGVWDATPSVYRTCSHCLVAQRWLLGECNGWLFSAVCEDVQDHVHEGGVWTNGGYGSPIARLVIGMRRRWQRFDGSGLMAVPEVPLTTHDKEVRA